MARQYFKATPTISNIWNGILHAYNGWIDTKTGAQTGTAPLPTKHFISLGTPIIKNGIKYYKDAAGKLKTAQEILKAKGIQTPIKQKTWFPKERHTDHYVPKNGMGIQDQLEREYMKAEKLRRGNPWFDEEEELFNRQFYY